MPKAEPMNFSFSTTKLGRKIHEYKGFPVSYVSAIVKKYANAVTMTAIFKPKRWE